MVAGHRSGAREAGAARAFAFNRLWLLDAAGVFGAVVFLWLVLAPSSFPLNPGPWPLREGALMLAIAALAVRAVGLRNRLAEASATARADMLRRLIALDDGLSALRGDLSREPAQRFVERRLNFAAGIDAGRRHLSEGEAGTAEAGLAICAELAADLAEAIPRRAGIASMAYRIRQEADRAVRRGEISPVIARELNSLIEDGCGVMDEALLADWNADHFGRLGAVQRSFGRQIERYEGEILRQIDHQAALLFAELNRHIRDKVNVADALRTWDQLRSPLELALGGLSRGRIAPEAAPQRLSATRFAASPLPQDSARRTAPPVRLPAAND